MKKKRKPKVGDIVFLSGEVKHIAMTLMKISVKESVEYGLCIWATSKFDENKELIHENHKAEFLLENLTLNPPPSPTQIFAH